MREAPHRPDLILPEAEAAALRHAYTGADVVLEYGSGGSTVMAAELGAEVWAVESDAAWAAGLRSWFAANPTPGQAHVLHADIGPTRRWGHPVDETRFRDWPDYPLSVWEQPAFRHPDVVLVDGRFRLACFLTVAFRIARQVTLFFDDYRLRKTYHAAETLLPPVEMIGRMARFDLSPTPLTPDRLRLFARALLSPV
ncbi:hypothetical protein LHP98_03260 [Rhodobacter sp. Har01]|uniref:hypothetical protein n=1 Tax=Rhodobacter sp. Har01 TaxID=2883999 RepID=UPI001D060D3A|nr:hypothetical protein [Rhodobacter sp. Har01]MCB6177147.1 hypothetical protein [Rhodobacter sp. Har01]